MMFILILLFVYYNINLFNCNENYLYKVSLLALFVFRGTLHNKRKQLLGRLKQPVIVNNVKGLNPGVISKVG